MKISTRPIHPRLLAAAFASIALLAVPAQADTYNFSNNDLNDSYLDPLNWSDASSNHAVPSLSSGDTAIISADGSAVTYNPGGDLIISNGGTLEISNGSFTQINGNNFFQLGEQGNGAGTGNGNLLVNGGTFNQGTISSNPFNIIGTGNTFTITSGAANFDQSLNIQSGLTWMQSGGNVAIPTGNEFDYDNLTTLMSGGTLTTGLITGNNVANSLFTFEGGTINLTNTRFGGVFGGSANQYLNFTLGSTGVINFENGDSVATVQGFIEANAFEFNNTPSSPLSDFSITPISDGVSLSLAGSVAAAPEPSTYLILGIGFSVLLVMLRRRAASAKR
jgi:hypothetical protein